MKRIFTAMFAVLALTFGAQGAYAAPNDPGDTPGKSPYHKTHGDQSTHAKPGKGGGKGLGHCKHSPGGCSSSNGGPGDPGDNGNGDNGDGDNGSSSSPALASTGA
ncbi:MAG: hypothetical protein ACRDOT_01605 [Aeromicrobium sp.]